MASKLENFTFQMKDFNVCELEWIKTCVERQLQQREDANMHPPCHILNLPAELRNRIYHFVILNHTKVDPSDEANIYDAPEIMLSCKQIRSEFLKYGKRTLTCRMLLSVDENDGFMEFRTITNTSIIKAIAAIDEEGYRGHYISGYVASREEAERDLLKWCDECGDDMPRSEYTGVIMEEWWLGDISGARCCHDVVSKDFLVRHL
ncbi:hypothetical protein AC579_4489 [Pseudocercospora musae]|uniref:F-box domain-containing protein n=1 Tax=Pseudocercospora musae TaxID=113226 RepID=A0A139I5Z6_9PEZI|nr:hypothetical protein AC579_4489 [Pseudocercospora musae]